LLDGEESPFLIMHGEDDEAVKVNNSIQLVERMIELGTNHTAIYLEGVGHGYDPAWRTSQNIVTAMQFLGSLLE
jgi:dipeptidyl aminopeptidase/acylaminoacyl peptidase